MFEGRLNDKLAARAILWIDDEPDLMLPFATRLDGAGFEVELVPTAQGGLVQARARAYDLILLDLRLPDADGLDLVPELRLVAPGVPIIVISSYGTLDVAHRAGTLGVTAFLSKPMRSAELLSLVRETVGRVGPPNPKSGAGEGMTGPDDGSAPVRCLRALTDLLDEVLDESGCSLIEFLRIVSMIRSLLDEPDMVPRAVTRARREPLADALIVRTMERVEAAQTKGRSASAKALAEAEGLRDYQLSKHLQRYTGCTVLELKRAARIRCVLRDMVRTDKSIRNIADCLGEHHRQIDTDFRAVLGRTPMEVRSLLIGGRCKD